MRELKQKLSQYLDLVEKGEVVWVTRRGKNIAVLTPASSPTVPGLLDLVEKGLAVWSGGRPSGSMARIKLKGLPLSQVVLEDRR